MQTQKVERKLEIKSGSILARMGGVPKHLLNDPSITTRDGRKAAVEQELSDKSARRFEKRECSNR
jgi:hypothetical protein